MATPSVVIRGCTEVDPLLLSSTALADAPGTRAESDFVVVGDVIDDLQQEGLLRGHGTHVVDGKLVATVCGVVERVNKLVSVRPLRSRYGAELGDVVVGRVTDIVGKRWRVDLKSRGEASLMLSAVNLPGGVQRRRTMEDELNMRSVFEEGDLLSAEVQSFHADGSIALHTRSLKYGKLVGGQLVEVPSRLLMRQKAHFVALEESGADVILGLNGLVWVSPHVERPPVVDVSPVAAETQLQPQQEPISPGQRQQMVRVANSVRVLAALGLAVTPSAIRQVAQLSLQQGVPLSGFLEPHFLAAVLAAEAGRRSAAAG